MPSSHTSKYSLNQWEKSDKVLMDDFNEDNQKIENALSALNASKADQTALNTLSSKLTSTQATIPQIAVGTYKGTGSYGSGGKSSLTFAFVPKLVVIRSEKASVAFISGQKSGLARVNLYDVYYTIAWSGKTVTWYMTGGHGDGGGWADPSAEFQMNKSSITYSYFAIG